MNDLYQKKEWKQLEEIDRAQLLLVIEGLKRGTIIGGNWTSFMDVLRENGLAYSLNSDPLRLDLVANVASAEVLEELNRKLLRLPDRLEGGEFHKITGWFLSYPECCTEEYIKPITPRRTQARKRGEHHQSYRFGEELTAKIAKDGSYPDIFDYRPPSYTPCSVDCKNATELLSRWKEAIVNLDPEAGKQLVHFNRSSLPESAAHQEYLAEENRRRNIEYRLGMLRGSVG